MKTTKLKDDVWALAKATADREGRSLQSQINRDLRALYSEKKSPQIGPIEASEGVFIVQTYQGKENENSIATYLSDGDGVKKFETREKAQQAYEAHLENPTTITVK